MKQQFPGFFDFQLGEVLLRGHMILLLKHVRQVIGMNTHGGGNIRDLQIIMVMQLHILTCLVGDGQAGVFGIIRTQFFQQGTNQTVHNAVGPEMGGDPFAGEIQNGLDLSLVIRGVLTVLHISLWSAVHQGIQKLRGLDAQKPDPAIFPWVRLAGPVEGHLPGRHDEKLILPDRVRPVLDVQSSLPSDYKMNEVVVTTLRAV